MGCGTSKQGCYGENKPKELGKCAACSSEVRWSWLRTKTLFSFSELRILLKVFQNATTKSTLEQQPCSSASSSNNSNSVSKLDSPNADTKARAISPPAALPTTRRARAPSSGVALGDSSRLPRMNKMQFLVACEADDTFRLSEVVGTFGSRLFDVFDEDGDGRLTFEDFVLGLSKLLKGPESEKLKLMYAAYDLSGVVPSEERMTSGRTNGSGNGFSAGGGMGIGIKTKLSRRSKYLTLEDMATVLTSASQGAYPTLLQFTTDGGNVSYWSGGVGPPSDRVGESKGADEPTADETRGGAEKAEAVEQSSSHDNGSGRAGGGVRGNDDPEQVAGLLQELARRNAKSYAERAVSEFGQVQDGTLTQKEFEKWALTGPVLRCRINEFSIDLNIVPFQGIRLE